MDKEKIKNDLILPHLNQGEELIGFFQATYLPSLWWYLLIGPFFALDMRIYYVAVTNRGLHLYKLNFFGKQDTYNFFPYSEFTKIKLCDGLIQAPLQLSFTNGKKLTIKA